MKFGFSQGMSWSIPWPPLTREVGLRWVRWYREIATGLTALAMTRLLLEEKLSQQVTDEVFSAQQREKRHLIRPRVRSATFPSRGRL